MAVKTIGGSDLATPRLVLGGNVFGWNATGAEAFAILDRFAEAGGTLIDTADVYSAWVPGHQGGESESLIGEWLKRRGGQKGVMIATKVGMLPWGDEPKLGAERIAAAAEASLKRLGIETIDLYYAHQDDPKTPLAETLGAFDRLVREGKVRTLGASNYSAGRLNEALGISTRDGLARYEALQNEHNLMSHGKYDGALQELCVARNIGVLPFYGLANGFLTGKYRSKDDLGKSVRGGRNVEYIDSPKGKSVLAALDDVAAETGESLAAVALAWTKAQAGITAPIASATSMKQAKELIAALKLDLSPGQIEALDRASE